MSAMQIGSATLSMFAQQRIRWNALMRQCESSTLSTFDPNTPKRHLPREASPPYQVILRAERRSNRTAAGEQTDYPCGLGEAEDVGALCSSCAGLGGTPAPSPPGLEGFGPPGGGIVPGVAPPLVGSPGGRCVGAAGFAWVPASSARSFNHA
jgi:hypothetical protein